MKATDMADNPNLYVESTAARQLVEALASNGWDGDDIGLAIESETSFAEAVSAAVRRLDELEELAGAADALVKRYKARKEALEQRRDALRDALTEALERSQAPLPLRLPEGTVGLQNTAPSAIITDEELVPDCYWRTSFTKKVDLRSVTLDLRDKKPVPGACLTNSRRSVQIRRA